MALSLRFNILQKEENCIYIVRLKASSAEETRVPRRWRSRWPVGMTRKGQAPSGHHFHRRWPDPDRVLWGTGSKPRLIRVRGSG